MELTHEKNYTHKKKKGFTFIEIAIVIAISAAAAAVLISIGASINSQNDVKEASREIAIIYTAVEDLYSNTHSDFTGLTISQLTKASHPT